MIGNIFFGYHDALKIYRAPKLCTETTYILEKINKNHDRK